METESVLERGGWNTAFMVSNVIGACVYVAASSAGWRNPEERGEIPITGEPFAWFGAIVPILAGMFVLHVIYGGFVIRQRDRQAGRLWLWTLPIWLVAVVIDFAHH